MENTHNPLKCSFKDRWDNKQIVELPVDNLWASVPIAMIYGKKEFYPVIKQDIINNGLHFPLLVVECTFAQLKVRKDRHKKAMNELPTGYKDDDILYVVWGGSNRLAIAKECNYTHVDCVIYKNGDFESAWKDQDKHRKPFKKFYS